MKVEEAPRLTEWLTATEVAEALDVSRQTVNRLINSGAFETLHLLGERPIYVVRAKEVEEMRRARRSQADTSV